MRSGELILSILKIILLQFIHEHVSMWRMHASTLNASSVIIKEICGHGVDRSDSGILIFDCGTKYLHQLAHQMIRWKDVLCAGLSKIIFLHL
jgi:ribonuclease BN (tRNA processing enzyme)